MCLIDYIHILGVTLELAFNGGEGVVLNQHFYSAGLKYFA